MAFKHLKRHLFIIIGCVTTFVLAGHIGLYVESLFSDLMSSTTVFGASVAGILTGFAKVYNYLFLS